MQGSYSLLLLAEDELIGVRDPRGFRPLVLGEVGGAYVLASETCALDLIEATYIREIEPGEMVVINRSGILSTFPFTRTTPSHCIFEFIYFARPDSYVFNQNVYTIRKEFGRQLARETGVAADVVIPVPDSGVPAALGYADESGIPFQLVGLTGEVRGISHPEARVREAEKLGFRSCVLPRSNMARIDGMERTISCTGVRTLAEAIDAAIL